MARCESRPCVNFAYFLLSLWKLLCFPFKDAIFMYYGLFHLKAACIIIHAIVSHSYCGVLFLKLCDYTCYLIQSVYHTLND
jgi:hypothetical protein